MKVKAEYKITIMEGPEKGREFVQSNIGETRSQILEIGTLESLLMEWRYLRPIPYGKYDYEDL